ncbi:hypothetical protein [Agaribacterium haliotis]|uniref:hypothetical protein n=1 Tax=Agaribacterium haliotis TaxID=2013869 RepID=UPI000BB55435|nr:hypothetical protein [Agaribacterium haliotis]
MNWLTKFSRPRGWLAVELGSEYVSFALARAGESKLHKLACMRCEQGSSSWPSLLEDYVNKHQLAGYHCRLVLRASDYQLLLVEAPEVPENELREALKWRVKELLQSSVEQSAIDVFTLPAGISRSGKTMAYVVAAELSLIKSLIELTKNADLELDSIDIEVLALRNLLQLKALERGAALVRLHQGAGEVSIYRDGDLYLSRNFKVDYGAGLLDELPAEQLALEIQRSLDYFERQMGQAPPGILYLCGEGIGPEKISEELKRSLSLPVAFLDLSEELGIDSDELDEGLLQLCLGAAGGALREQAS